MNNSKSLFSIPSDKEIEKYMPGLMEKTPQACLYTPRRIANVITYHCFRNTEIENIHKHISDKEMMKTMIETSAKVHYLLSKNKFWKMEPEEIVDYCFFSSFHNIAAKLPKTNLKKLHTEATHHILSAQEIHTQRPTLFEAWIRLSGSSVDYWDRTTMWDGQKLRARKGVKPKEPGHQYLQK